MIRLEEAYSIYNATIDPLPRESIPIRSALNRALADAVQAPNDIPRFDFSTMDGYVLYAEDVADVTIAKPAVLPVAHCFFAGAQTGISEVVHGTASRIFTGAPIPDGPNTVIAKEHAETEQKSGQELLRFSTPFPKNQNICRRGSRLLKGMLLADRGQRITPTLLAALIDADVDEVIATRHPRIKILVTGDELRYAGEPLRHGEIHSSNGPLIEAVLETWGCTVSPFERVADSPEAVTASLKAAFDFADLVITTGGTAGGDRDFVISSAKSIGVKEIFRGVSHKPAKSLFFGLNQDRALLALPGNPGGVLLGLVLHARYILDRLAGQSLPGPRWSAGTLADSVQRSSTTTKFIPMHFVVNDNGLIQLLQKESFSVDAANSKSAHEVLVCIPPGDSTCERGSTAFWTDLPM